MTDMASTSYIRPTSTPQRTRRYIAPLPPKTFNCWRCPSRNMTGAQLQKHLDLYHQGWQYEAIKKLGLHKVG